MDTNEAMLVSIIIPVYNVKEYLAEALDSVVNQTYRNLEIIIIDDGSTDGSGAICNEYAARDARIRLIRQENKGLSAARNAGLEVMTGEAAAFLDSDDAYHPDYIAGLVGTMLREAADLVVCKYMICHTVDTMTSVQYTGKALPVISAGAYDRISALQKLADSELNVMVWNKLYLSRLWRNIRFSEGHVYEDNEVAYMILDQC